MAGLVKRPLLLFSLLFGGYKWWYYAMLGVPTPTGTVMLATLSLIVGAQILLAATAIDLQSLPKVPLSKPLIDLN
jgi:dolichol-phosphate mannosyltransferase